MPPHVTILYPFVPASQLDPSVRRSLAAIALTTEPFEVTFARIGRFPGVVYLAPDPAEPFVRLTEAVASRFPEHPPYGGAFEEVVPHLTVVEGAETASGGQSTSLDAIASEATRSLPIRRAVRALEVIVQGDDGRWRRHWRLALGVRP